MRTDLQVLYAGMREAAAWTTWTSSSLKPAEDREDWTAESPGFRALLRMAVAIEGPLSPETFERLPVIDGHCLDSTCCRTHNVEIAETRLSTAQCALCGTVFLLVR
jgi:hypothetical protein